MIDMLAYYLICKTVKKLKESADASENGLYLRDIEKNVPAFVVLA